MPHSIPNPQSPVDVLARVVDRARAIVYGKLKVRPKRVYVVTRTWSGPSIGEGSIATPTVAQDGTTVSTEMELVPQPEVVYTSLHAEQRPAGREEEGDIVIKGISLAYSQSELYPRTSGTFTEWAIRVDDAHGTGSAPEFYFPSEPPRARRGDQPGDDQDWVMRCHRVLDMQNGDQP